MRAVVCTNLSGEDGLAVVDDWPEPGECGPHDVRIDVRAVSVNFPDTLITRGLYQIRRDPQFVLGCEAAGVVIEVGENVGRVAVGDRVLTLAGVGAFAAEILVRTPMQQVHALPAGMTFAHGAAFNLAYGTAGHGLVQRAHLRAGETVLINGAAGGCGSAAIQIAKAMGARIIAVAGGEEKTALARSLGADEAIDHHELEGDRALSETVKALTRGRGVDVVFDNVGGDVRENLRCLGWNARYLVVGFAGGEVPSVPLNLTILRSISVIGVAYGASAVADPAANDALFAQLFSWYGEGRLTPHIGAQFVSAGAADAVRLMHDRKAMGKIVIDFTH